MARDPVCGMTVDPATAAAHVEHLGDTYYFCAKSCAQKFSANPEKYLNAPAVTPIKSSAPLTLIQSAPAPAAGVNVPAPQSQVRYTCPMHPEIVQLGPGACPKCGMALEPMDMVALGPDDAPDPEYVSMRNRFWASAILSAPLLILAMLGEKLRLPVSGSVLHWIEFLLAVPVVLWGGWPFFHRFWS